MPVDESESAVSKWWVSRPNSFAFAVSYFSTSKLCLSYLQLANHCPVSRCIAFRQRFAMRVVSKAKVMVTSYVDVGESCVACVCIFRSLKFSLFI